jgi:hypothetical protein
MKTSVTSHPQRGPLLPALAALALWLVADAGAGPAAPASEQAAPPPEVTAPSDVAPAPPAGLPMTAMVFERDRDAIFKAFYETGLDSTKPYAVTNLAIRKDNMTLLLKQGTLFFMEPIAGEVTGAAFVGQGEASMTPPNTTERYMLNKHYGAEVLKEPFSEAVFRFSDGTDRTFRAAARPDPAGAAQAARAAEIFRDRNNWLDGTRQAQLEIQFLENRISDLKGQNFFFADFHSAKHDWIGYLYDPREIHEHYLVTSETLGAKGRRYLVPWTVWHESSDYGPSGHYVQYPDRDGPRALKIRHNEMTLNFRNTKTVEWEAKLKIEPLTDSLRCLRFDLVNNAFFSNHWYETDFFPVTMVSVTAEDGQRLEFMHKKDQLLVFLPQPARAGSLLPLTFKGRGDTIEQLTAESFGLIQAPWFPQYGYLGGRHPFHWTVRVPKPFLIAGSGKVLREFEDKATDQNGLEMGSSVPVNFPWLIFGRFQKAQSTYPGEDTGMALPLTLHSFPNMSIPITDRETLEFIGARAPITLPLTAPRKKIEGYFDEGKAILKIFEKIYGPFPYEELHIAQMAPQLNFGQSPPGFLQLTGLAFMSQASFASGVRQVGETGVIEMELAGPGTKIDFIHGFLSHEMAHQWWGNQVGWASGDDEWISESFAEYAAGIFVKAYQGEKRFQGKLEEWRRNAKYSDKEAPIAAANTLSGPNAGDHRTKLLYDKGPYVLHMLRVQLNDDKYIEVMRSIQDKFRHQNISTEMLLSQVNKITGSDYTSFFDQWFWDVGVPTFKYSWRSEKQADGKFLITIHVSQEDGKNFKKVLMPVHIHFKDKTIPQYRPIIQAEQDIKILSPAEPKNVTLDDDRTLLAEFVKAG